MVNLLCAMAMLIPKKTQWIEGKYISAEGLLLPDYWGQGNK